MRRRKEWRSFALFLLPGFAGVCALVLVPFSDVIRRSFVTAVTEQYVGFSNYRRVFANEAFRLAVKNTVRFTAVSLPLLLALGLFAAMLLSGLKEVQLWKSVFLLPMAMPAATAAIVWRMVFSKGGFLNLALGTSIDFMETGWSFWVLVFSYVWKNLGYTVILWLAGIHAVPADTMEAARADGAGTVRLWRSIILPQTKGAFFTIAVLSFLNTFKAFREAYLVAGPYPQESIYLLSHLFNNWFASLDVDKMAAAAVCMAGVLLIFILLFSALCLREDSD